MEKRKEKRMYLSELFVLHLISYLSVKKVLTA